MVATGAKAFVKHVQQWVGRDARDVVGLAVDELVGRAHDSTVQLNEQLMAEADTEDRDLARKLVDQIGRDAGLVGGARAGRDDEVRGCQGNRLGDGDGIVATHDNLIGTCLGKAVGEVVRK